MRRKRWAGHVALIAQIRNVKETFVGRSKVNVTLRRPNRRWENYIKMHVREIGRVWTG
jgi:hypothetical protein